MKAKVPHTNKWVQQCNFTQIYETEVYTMIQESGSHTFIYILLRNTTITFENQFACELFDWKKNLGYIRTSYFVAPTIRPQTSHKWATFCKMSHSWSFGKKANLFVSRSNYILKYNFFSNLIVQDIDLSTIDFWLARL